MSSLAVPAPIDRVYRFYQTTVGKKAIMAVTGVILFAFILGHLAGNLQVFEGPAKFDAYAIFLRSLPAALWSARIILLVSVTLHIVATIQREQDEIIRAPLELLLTVQGGPGTGKRPHGLRFRGRAGDRRPD